MKITLILLVVTLQISNAQANQQKSNQEKNLQSKESLVETSQVETTKLKKICGTRCHTAKIESYFLALDKVAQQGSGIQDIDALLDLMHKDVKYIHVEYQANFDKASWRNAFIRNLKRGMYKESQHEQRRILSSIAGKNHIAIEYAHGGIQSNGDWLPGESKLVLFGFIGEKISLVKELW